MKSWELDLLKYSKIQMYVDPFCRTYYVLRRHKSPNNFLTKRFWKKSFIYFFLWRSKESQNCIVFGLCSKNAIQFTQTEPSSPRRVSYNKADNRWKQKKLTYYRHFGERAPSPSRHHYRQNQKYLQVNRNINFLLSCNY